MLFAFDDKPTLVCKNKYVLADTVKIDGFDYWYIYKRLNQKHESNYDSNTNLVGEEGLEPSRLLRSADFKSAAYAIPPLAQVATLYNQNYY